MNGYIHVYTGNGKGKTTAALGLAIRAAGAGIKVYMGQFIKSGGYSELGILKEIKKQIKVESFGRGCFIKGMPEEIDIELARKGLDRVRKILAKKMYGLVILDEINIAAKAKLIKVGDIVKLIKSKPKNTELVLTGRYAHPEIIKLADLVTEMREIKHYYKKAVKARRGIEY